MMINSQPAGDMWSLFDRNPQSQHYGKSFKFDFKYIKSKEMKEVVKDYIWLNYRTENRAVNTLYLFILTIKLFFRFTESRNITRFVDLTNIDINNFISYLHITISKSKGKKISYRYQKHALDALKAIIHWCQIHKPDSVPEVEIFTGNEYTGINRKLRIEFIPDDILEKINEALPTEENPYIKYGIIILESAGMRIGDLFRLSVDCIKPHLISGYTIEWFQHKGRKNKPPMPVRSECKEAVDRLKEYTRDFREKADDRFKDFLFIKPIGIGNTNRPGEIVVLSQETFQRWLDDFIVRNDIRNSDGELYNLTSHQFKRTLGTDMLSKGINIKVIQDVLGHSDPSTTKRYYADVKDKERAEIFQNIGIVGNINMIDRNIFESPSELEWFQENKDKGACMCDGYCTKPFKHGQICERLLKRQKCYSCKRYITTPEFLEYHKNYLNGLERQLEENVLYGEHYAEHFRPTIEVLKIIIKRLEELQDARR